METCYGLVSPIGQLFADQCSCLTDGDVDFTVGRLHESSFGVHRCPLFTVRCGVRGCLKQVVGSSAEIAEIHSSGLDRGGEPLGEF